MTREHRTAFNQGSLRVYLFGFIASIILTLIPFELITHKTANHFVILSIIVALAIIQILVHLVFFLHLRFSFKTQSIIALLYTLLLITIIVGASLWIMYHLHQNLMT